MPGAGGHYVFLRAAFGPLWGFLYGWTMLLVIQTATIAAVAIAFAKFTGVLVPWFSSSAWLWQIGTFGPYRLWFGELGPYTVGLNTRSEEHTSELQSLAYLVCRLLLEKKKKTK